MSAGSVTPDELVLLEAALRRRLALARRIRHNQPRSLELVQHWELGGDFWCAFPLPQHFE
jgi:hypothetical protein